MDNSVLKTIQGYRTNVSWRFFWYLLFRVVIIFLCILCVAVLTYLISGNCLELRVTRLTKLLMVFFIVLALLLGGYVFYCVIRRASSFHSALARLDILILKMKVDSVGDAEDFYRELKLILRILES